MRKKIPINPFNRISIAVILTTLLLAGFIVFLLVSNYTSLQKLRESSLKQYQYKIEQRSIDLSHLLSDRNHNILELARTQQIHRYFENRALGMSMEYGLRSSIQGIARELENFINSSRHGREKLFSKLFFYDTEGNIIAESSGSVKDEISDLAWRQKIVALPHGSYVFHHEEETVEGIFFVQPFFFKGSLKGQLVLWLSPELLKKYFSKTTSSALFTGILYPPERCITCKGTVSARDDNTSSIFVSEANLMQIQAQLEKSQNTLLFQVPLSPYGYKLVEIASSKIVLGGSSPVTLLIALALLGIIILAATLLLMKVLTRNIALQTRIDESAKREEEIEQKNKQLQAEIRERERAEKARMDLETQLQRVQKMEAIGLLAGGVAHDLNNILSGLVSYPELLLTDLPEDSPMRKPLTVIQQSGVKASAIVQDLLTLARRGVAIPKVLNLNLIIEDYLQSPEHAKMIEIAPEIKIESLLAPDLLNILGSPVHLSKTIMNLVSNAIEACPNGGKIVLSTENRYLDLPVKGYDVVLEGEYVIVKIVDEGVGISPNDLERIFEPFYTNKKMGRSGTGLGMAVVWGTVKDHIGYIELKSTLGAGTEIIIYFPVTRQAKETEREAADIAEYYGNGELILVVDDIEDQRIIAEDILKKLRYNVVIQSSGERAVEYLSSNSVDLVILDMIMDPGIDGLTTYQEILKINPKQKALITSGYSETDRAKEALTLGACKYISKPYTIESIAAAVQNSLSSSDA